jgi:AraC-like DNA-binding protein
VPEGDNVALSYGVIENASQPRAATDFAIGSIYKLLRRNVAIDESAIHVRFVHQEPGYVSEYARVFGVPVRFGAQSNAIVMPRSQLIASMLRADARIARAFELRAAHLLQKLKRVDATAERVRELVSQHLDSGQVTMAWTARRLAMSVPTLRRHLEAEGTTYREIVDELRRHVAERELRDGSTSVGELAFLLGFANVGAFHRAFKRWTGIAPTRFRVTSRSEPPAALLD